MLNVPNIMAEAAQVLADGGVIAYPTEAVYGLGCDPKNTEAIRKLLALKQRHPRKGLILIASDFLQLEPFIQPIAPAAFVQVKNSWPGPYTWVFPAQEWVPYELRGDHNTLAVRVSAHPTVKKLCDRFGSAIVSTSANKSGRLPTRDQRTTAIMFNNQVDLIVPGKVGGQNNPTEIRDAITGETLRRA